MEAADGQEAPGLWWMVPEDFDTAVAGAPGGFWFVIVRQPGQPPQFRLTVCKNGAVRLIQSFDFRSSAEEEAARIAQRGLP